MRETGLESSDPEARRQHARDVAWRYLDRRDRTVLEVRRRLEHDGVEPGTIEEVVDELCAGGWLDDRRYAQRFAEDKRRLAGWGPDRIERRLLAAGIEPELAAAAVADREHGDEVQAAVAVLRGRLAAPPESARDRQRALGLLLRRGFDLEQAHDALRAWAADVG